MKTGSLKQSAGLVGKKFEDDVELSIPLRPKFPREILAIPYGQTGILFEGAQGSQVLNGRAARFFIPNLLEHLNGKNTIQDLRSYFPKVPEHAIRDAVALLYSRGLLEDGDSVTPPELSDLSSFAGRYADVTRINKNRGEVLDRLAARSVALLGQQNIIDSLDASLQGQGLKKVTRVAQIDEVDEHVDLLIIAVSGDVEDFRAVFEAAHKKRIRVLHAHFGTTTAEIGPLFMPGQSGCYDCLRQLYDAPESEVSSKMHFWAAVLALNAFHVLSRLGTPRLYNTCHVYREDAQGRYYDENKIARLPGCKNCGLEGKGLGSDDSHQVWLLHNFANSMPPRELMSPRDYQHHYAAANISITKEVPEPYYGSIRVDFPASKEPEQLQGTRASARLKDGNNFEFEDLSTLLRLSVGYESTADGMRRVAPSGGGLGSAELFVISRGIKGLDDGVYHYYAYEHYLEYIKQVPNPLLQGALGITSNSEPQLVLVGVGSLTKLRQKYGSYAFRFSTLDGGFTRCYLHHMLTCLGYDYTEFTDLRDKVLAEAIGLPTAGNRHVVTFALGVGSDLRDTYQRETSPHMCMDTMVELSGRLGPTHCLNHEKSRVSVIPDDIIGLKKTFAHRYSERNFAEKAIPLETLTAVCESAYNGYLARIDRSAIKSKLVLRVAVNRSDENYQPGIYVWSPSVGRLEVQREGLTPEQLDETMLQKSLARAPAVLYITGDFEYSAKHYGARGFRDLVSCAGTLSGEALLAGVSLGIYGCPWGGLAEDAWGPLLGIDRYSDCPLFGTSLGYPA